MTPEARNGVHYLRPDEVCALLNVSRSALRRIDRDWPFKVRFSHKLVRYEERGLLRWLEMRKGLTG